MFYCEGSHNGKIVIFNCGVMKHYSLLQKWTVGNSQQSTDNKEIYNAF